MSPDLPRTVTAACIGISGGYGPERDVTSRWTFQGNQPYAGELYVTTLSLQWPGHSLYRPSGSIEGARSHAPTCQKSQVNASHHMRHSVL